MGATRERDTRTGGIKMASRTSRMHQKQVVQGAKKRSTYQPDHVFCWAAWGGRSRVLPHVFLRGSKSRDVAAGCKRARRCTMGRRRKEPKVSKKEREKKGVNEECRVGMNFQMKFAKFLIQTDLGFCWLGSSVAAGTYQLAGLDSGACSSYYLVPVSRRADRRAD